ncbi:hypothetical protein MPTK1_2g13340 [Marchantia polymorpha subsp. ruderalis]|uniref:Uncharacterized protein n=2 Tax=Marchantia polymorpha TaxID=3197 RepID=A0A176VTG2_MARPO|nr:hypothetical protein AXG93_2253s1020 [Marchantia polymorpha subsp. ruderalis]PTQ43146.1 hypothetical protein MARPO_0026s0038 [Marchantia polymorpha]BBN02171.1 hypothetical protein Mp_2g13340 [Marchantia polymorpha subsp. ruderalis]|eukprot:PTQ43146.1 hypothetical protein MARPO_0026s0038 [Marchantia polymorpha]
MTSDVNRKGLSQTLPIRFVPRAIRFVQALVLRTRQARKKVEQVELGRKFVEGLLAGWLAGWLGQSVLASVNVRALRPEGGGGGEEEAFITSCVAALRATVASRKLKLSSPMTKRHRSPPPPAPAPRPGQYRQQAEGGTCADPHLAQMRWAVTTCAFELQFHHHLAARPAESPHSHLPSDTGVVAHLSAPVPNYVVSDPPEGPTKEERKKE